MRPLLLIITLNFISFFSYSQWSKTYGDTGFETGYSVEKTNDGGYILLGATTSFGSDDMDIWIVKTNSFGDTLWSKIIGDTAREEGFTIIQASDGGYVLTASKGSYPNYQTILIKTNDLGDTLWSKSFDGPELFSGTGLEQTVDGGYLISGNITTNLTTGPYNTFLIKTDANGDTLWTNSYGGNGYETGIAKETSNGGFIISSMSTSFGNASQFWLIRTDNLGDTLWTKVLGDVGNEGGVAIETSDNGFIIAGSQTTDVISSADVWLVKTDINGNILWEHTYGGSNHDASLSIEETSDNGFIIGARTESFGHGLTDFWLIRTDNLGDTLWTNTYGGPLNDYPGHCHQTIDNGFVFYGYTESFGNGDFDLWLIKTDENGILSTIENDINHLEAFPNPVTKTLNINGITEANQVNIYAPNGSLVKSVELLDNKVEVSDLTNGLYFISVISKDKYHTIKFIKE